MAQAPEAPQAPTFAVVIPAHDEESVIGRCLRFAAELEPGEAEIVVVANGCQDATARAAARAPGVTVVEVPAAGKAAALNAGDRASSAFPRIYLDADIEVDVGALRSMRDRLVPDRPLVCAPAVRFRTEGRPWTVRAFYRIYAGLPYASENLVGLGIYGVSAAGRRRFGSFPPVTNDDRFVQQLFSPQERVMLRHEEFGVETPRTLAALVAVRTRVAAGNAELASLTGPAGLPDDVGHRSTGGSTLEALARMVARRPYLLPHATVYAGVVAVARWRSRAGSSTGRHTQTEVRWLRDNTTR